MNYVFHVCVMIGIYLPLAYSLNLPLGFGGLVVFCHAAFYGVGAYGYVLLSMKAGLPPVAALGCAILLTAVIAGLIGLICLRFRGDLFLFITLGFQIIVFVVLYNWVGLTNGPYGIYGIPRPEILGLRVLTPRDYAILADKWLKEDLFGN